MTLDNEASAVYSAEAELRQLLALADESEMRRVRWYDSILTMPIELRFHDLPAVRRYVAVLAQLEGVPIPAVHPKVGAESAYYWFQAGSIFVPSDEPAGQWTMRQHAILHEFAHHAQVVRTGDSDHGDGFRRTYLPLIERHMGDEVALVLRTGFAMHAE